jgi:tripartite-type tricarboxylate transporter receptor subunit TctC
MARSFHNLIVMAAVAACAVVPLTGEAQTGFKSTIRIIVPYAPGGGADVGARLLAPGLSRQLGQNVIVENKAGASGQIGTQYVQHAAPDGQTLLFTVDHSLLVVPLTTPGVSYDFSRDFISLGLAFRSAWVLSVPASAPYKDFKAYAEAVKKDPKWRSYAVPYVGGAPEAVGNALGRTLGVEMTPIPFAGSAPALQSVVAAQVPASSTGMPDAVALNEAGRVKVIAITGPKRSILLRDVPTFEELGVRGLEPVRTLIGFFAPKGLPPAMAREFNAALRTTLADPKVHDQLLRMSLEPASTSLEEATREMEDSQRFWKAAITPTKH